MYSDHLIETYLQDNLPRYLDLLRRMVEINSFTTHAQGVNALAELTAREFARLGFEADFIPSVHSGYGNHLFLHRTDRTDSMPALALISHLDTVFSPEEEQANDFTWRPQGERIYGPGTVDIKGGTVMIFMVLETLKWFAPQAFGAIDWRICLDASEEALSDDFGRLCLQKLPESTRACLVFEGGTVNPMAYPVVTARKGRAAYRVRVEGKSAHAGNYHHLGANAILQLAATISKIAALTDYERQITFNVGKISGGTVVNRVPHLAEARGEMRAFLPEIYAQGVADLLALAGEGEVSSTEGYRCKVKVEVTEQTAPWPRNPNTEHLFEIWIAAGEDCGLNVSREERGGLSDGNMIWHRFPTLDGLGPAGDNAHCSERSPDGSKDQEYVLASSFVPKARLNIAALLRLVKSL